MKQLRRGVPDSGNARRAIHEGQLPLFHLTSYGVNRPDLGPSLTEALQSKSTGIDPLSLPDWTGKQHSLEDRIQTTVQAPIIKAILDNFYS